MEQAADKTSTDSEDRKQAEEAQQATERDLAAIINTIPTTAWTTRPDGYCDFLNQRWLDYTGMTAEQATGWGWAETIHPDDRKRLVAYWQSALASGVPVEAEARMRRFDGAYRWFFFCANPVRDASGKIVKWYGTNIDIEDRKRVEEALRASEISWRQIVDNIPALVATTGAMGEVEFLNRQTLDYFGKTREELQNWALIDAVHPDDLPQVIEARKKSIETGQIYEVEHRCRRADGVYRWFQVRGLPVRNAEDTITAWYLLLTDIDNLKEVEDALRRDETLLAKVQELSATGGFYWWPETGKSVWTEQVYRIFELDPTAPPTTELRQARIHPDDIALHREIIERAIREPRAFEYDVRLLMPDNSIKYVHSLVQPTEDAEGSLLYVGAVQDVTQRRLSELALNEVRSELAHMARVSTLNAFTASIAHEINQPLSGILTNASTCLRALDADPPNVDVARETARRTIRDVNRASEVITRLRGLFSKREFTPEPLDLNEATQEVIALSLSDLQRNRVTLRSELAQDLPPVSGDRVQLQQVLLNLLRNACDAMVGVDDRPRQLLIRTRPEGDDRVCLSVQDAGTGIDPQDLERLFAAFHTTKSEGMGIGLSVSRSIIERHHGRLWAEPNDGPGATFSFTLPVAPAGATDAVPVTRASSSSSSS